MRLRRTKRTERGATAVEYGLLVAMIAGVIITIVTVLGTEVFTLYSLSF